MYLQEPPRGDGASSSVNFLPCIGLASADVIADRDAWKRIATGKTGSKGCAVKNWTTLQR